MIEPGIEPGGASDGSVATPVPWHRWWKLGFIFGILGAATTIASYFVPVWGGDSLVGGLIHSMPTAGVGNTLVGIVAYFGIPILVIGISIAGLRAGRRTRLSDVLFGVSAIAFLPVLWRVLQYWRSPFGFSIATDLPSVGMSITFVGGIASMRSLHTRGVAIPAGADEAAADAPPGGAVLGFAIAVCGALLFVGASFLASFRFPASFFGSGQAGHFVTFSQYQRFFGGAMQTGADTTFVGNLSLYPVFPSLSWFTAFGHAYGSAAIIGTLALGGIFGRRPGRWAAVLVGASAVWAAELVRMMSTAPTVSWLIGYWGAQLGIGLAFIGGVIAFTRVRTWPAEPAATLFAAGRGLTRQSS